MKNDFIFFNTYLNKYVSLNEAESEDPFAEDTQNNSEDPFASNGEENSEDPFGSGGGSGVGDDPFGGGDTGDTNASGSSSYNDDENILDKPTGNGDENAKKLVLFSQYKEILDIYEEILLSIEKISPEKINDKDFAILMNLKQIIENNQNNITFILNHKIVNTPYFKLLKWYYYFKESLMDSIHLLEKINK